MRKILIIFLLLHFQSGIGQNFNYLYGGSEENWGNDIIETYDKGYMIASSMDDWYGRINLIKIDVNGNILWQKVIGNISEKIAPMSIIKTEDYGYLITGVEYKYDPPPQGGNSFAMKLNECGEIEWTKTYGSYGNMDYITDAVQTDDKGFAMIASGIDNNNIVLLKTDSVGHLEFKKHYFDTSTVTGLVLSKCMNGDLMFSGFGYFQNPGGIPAGWWQRGIVCRVDKNGNEKWNHILGLDTLIFSATTYCTELPDSSIVCGTTWRSQSNGSVTKPYVFKLDKNGILQWRRFVGDTAWFDSDVNGIIQTDTNKVFLLSGRYCDPVYHGVFLYRVDTLGIFQDSAGYDYDHYCWTGNLKAVSDHKLIYCGTQDNGGNYQAQLIRLREDLSIDTVLNIQLNYDSLCGHVIPAIEYLPFDTSYHIGVEDVVKEELEWLLFPNPAKDEVNIKINKPLAGDADVCIYNFQGSLMKCLRMNKGTSQYPISTKEFANGIYLVQINATGGALENKKLIILK